MKVSLWLSVREREEDKDERESEGNRKEGGTGREEGKGREIENMNTQSSPVMRRLSWSLPLQTSVNTASVYRLPKDACDSGLEPLAFSRGVS